MSFINKISVLIFSVFFAFTSFAQADIKTVSNVDVGRFLGVWYQIARNPVIFEAGCVCSRQVLNLNQEGSVDVTNTCNFLKEDGRILSIRGTAQSVEPGTNSKFAVDFGLPWKGDYWIVGLDTEYRFAVVTDRHQQSLYILSKTPALAPELYTEALAQAETAGVNVSKLKLTPQQSCQYPN